MTEKTTKSIMMLTTTRKILGNEDVEYRDTGGAPRCERAAADCHCGGAWGAGRNAHRHCGTLGAASDGWRGGGV